ncbi:hypothetical protein RV11_GL000491 [Enterococcus phoeniculicola]|nr:hypothetical protein RV11_GL000491 [Enterococcus phoeniculicola]
MQLVTPFLEILVFALNILSIIVLIWGVICAGIDFLRSDIMQKDRMKAAQTNNFIKSFLGSYILLSLEILIAADIIESIINPSLSDILRLAALVVIRTVISYFLHQEIQDALEHEKQSGQ